jgi:hypothetical protein
MAKAQTTVTKLPIVYVPRSQVGVMVRNALTRSQFFAVTNTLKCGEDREWVVNGLAGRDQIKGTAPARTLPANMVHVFCNKKQAWRTLNLDTVKSMRTEGRFFQFVD